jgi:hypothetical protein
VSLDSRASETNSSSTVGRGGGGPRLRGSRLRLRCRGASWSTLRKEGALVEVGVALPKLCQRDIPKVVSARTHPDGLFALEVLKYPFTRSSLISRLWGPSMLTMPEPF